MTWIPAVVSGAATLAGALNRPKAGPSIRSIDDRYRSENVGGYLSPEDQAMVERTRTSGMRTAQRGADLTRASIYRRVVGRGLSGASAEAMGLEADQQAAEGRDRANEVAAGEGDKLYLNNEGYARDKQMTAWGNDVAESRRQTTQSQAADATFWNSALESIPAVASLWGGASGGGSGLATSTNPFDYGGTSGVPLTPRG